MSRRRGRVPFTRLADGRYYSEWYGTVTWAEMRMIRNLNMSPSDWDLYLLDNPKTGDN